MGQLYFKFDWFDLPVDLFIYIYIPIIIYAIVFIIANIFVILSGKNQKEEVLDSKYLIWVGEINIIFAIISFFIPNLSFSGTLDIFQIIIWVIYRTFISGLDNIITLVTFGIIVVFFGKRNENIFGNNVKRSGQLRLIYQSLGIFISLLVSSYLFSGLTAQTLSLITVIPFVLSIVLILAAIIFLIIHGYNQKDKYFLCTGILLIIHHFLPLIFGFIPHL